MKCCLYWALQKKFKKTLAGSYQITWASLVAQMVKNPPAMRETWIWSLVWEDRLEEGMATHSSILACRIPWTEGPGGLQSMGSPRIRHNWVTAHSTAHQITPPATLAIEMPVVLLVLCKKQTANRELVCSFTKAFWSDDLDYVKAMEIEAPMS